MIRQYIVIFITVLFISSNIYAERVAVLKRIEGKVSILRKGATKWRDARLNLPIKVGDAVFTRDDAFAEIVYSSGAVLRMDENTKIVVDKIDSLHNAKTTTSLGKVWVNMKAMTGAKPEFEVASPTATAAIRGTVFYMDTKQDSSTDVNVMRGKVAVGPGSKFAKKEEDKKNDQPVAATGPVEVPGPFEVSLSEWKTIVAGQVISVRKDGKYSQKKFDTNAMRKDTFVQKNVLLDSESSTDE